MKFKMCCLAALVVLSVQQAGAITWSLGPDFIGADGHQNISTNGTLVEAFNFGGPDLIVDTGSEMITFVENQTIWPNGAFSTANGSLVASTDSNWVDIVHRADWSPADPFTFTIENLTVGDDYQVEFFVYDNRNADIGTRTFTFADVAGNLSPESTNGAGLSVIGTFTAVAETEEIFASQSATDPTANAYVLRNVTDGGGGGGTLACDADGDGDCILDDIDAMYGMSGSPGAFDFDGSGAIDPGDIDDWLAAASTTDNSANPNGNTFAVGDANLDGAVNSLDLGPLLNNFGADGGSPGAGVGWGGGDLNMDGVVNSVDLGALLNNFNFPNAASNVSAVPEPHGLTLLFSCLLAAVAAGRRLMAKNGHIGLRE